MTLAKLPVLDPDIARLPVDADAQHRWAWPLAGLLERDVAIQRDVEELATRLDVLLTRYDSSADVDSEADAIIGLCRPNGKPGKKAGARVVLLLAALAAQRASVPDKVIRALAAALDLKRLHTDKRAGVDVTWLGDPDTVALQVIQRLAVLQDKKTNQGDRLGVRLAVYDLICWHRQQGRATSPLALNALAAVVELVHPTTGAVQGLPGRHPRALQEVVERDYDSEEVQDDANRALVRAAKQLGYAELRRLAYVEGQGGSDAFWRAADNKLIELLPPHQDFESHEVLRRWIDDQVAATVEKLLAEPKTSAQWAGLVDLAGLTPRQLFELSGTTPPAPRRTKVEDGPSRSSVYEYRKDPRYQVLVDRALWRLDQPRRIAEEMVAMQSDAFAAANVAARLSPLQASAVLPPEERKAVLDGLMYSLTMDAKDDRPATPQERAKFEVDLDKMADTLRKAPDAKARLRAKGGA